MPLLPRYKRVSVTKTSARTGKRYNYTAGYITPRGKRLSRYEYDTRRLRRTTSFKNRSELERFQREISGSRWLSDIYKATGKPPTWEDFSLIRDVRDRRRDLPRDERGRTIDSDDPDLVAKDGPLAQLLERTGRRPLSGYSVGDSP